MLESLLKTFFEEHDPTQGMRQGNDVGTTYRSAVYTTAPEQLATTERVRDTFQAAQICRPHVEDHHGDRSGR